MRLLLLSSEFPPGPGGLGTHAYHVARQLSTKGWNVRVLTAQDYADEEEIRAFNSTLSFPVIRLHSLHGWLRDGLSRAKALRAEILRELPDLVIATGQRSVWLAGLLLSGYRIPYVAIAHGSEFGQHPLWSWLLTRWAFEKSRGVISVSEYAGEVLKEAGVRPRHRVVIPNGADHEMFGIMSSQEIARFRELHLPRHVRILLTVGQLSRRKGQEVVIRALPDVLRSCEEVYYVMVGQPTIQGRLEEVAREVGVEKHIRCTGRLSPYDVVRWLNVCDVFLMTSQVLPDGDCEGYGIAAVEAALCGKPAIVSAGTGLAEAIVDQVTGLAVKGDDPAMVARAVIGLLNDHPRRKAMGEAARKRAIEEQTWERRGVAYHETLSHLVVNRILTGQ